MPPRIRLLLAVLLPTLGVAGGDSRAAEPTRTLTTALEVRSLSPAEAERGHPVRLRGVVILVEGISAIFLQDETSTTFFRVRTPPTPRVGDEVVVVGKTRMGHFLPGVGDSTVEVVGRRALPAGTPVHYDDLHFGRFHYQRVAIDGIVRSVQPVPGPRPDSPPRSLLRLALGSQVVEVRLEVPPPPDSLVDHRVRVTGLAAGLINITNRQLVRPYLRTLDWNDVVILAPAPPLSEVPHLSAEELHAFRISGLGEQRVRIDGTVTATFGDNQVFLQQGHRAFSVRFGSASDARPGERLTVAGFPSMERFSASVVDAELLERAPGTPPAPEPVASIGELFGDPPDPFPGRHDGRLVRLDATYLDTFKNEDGRTLLVQDRTRTLQTWIPEGTPLPEPGSLVRLTGICQVENAVGGSGFASRPGLVRLRVPSPAGIEILRHAPWWTPRRLTLGLAALAGLTLLSGLWIAVLRRQVARQTDALAARIQSEAALAERQRIAREFHDSLEQELAGVSLRLDALATRPLDDKGRNLIGATRNLVSRIQSETRDLIADLRDATETAGDLPAALAAVAARHAADSGADVRFESRFPARPLPPAIVHDLRMIAREAATNALKHGRASHIRIELQSTAASAADHPLPGLPGAPATADPADALVLRISDNGCGFDPASALETKRGHFGCAGIRERARKIGATVVWRSTLQRGTTVEVTLPLAPDPLPAPPASRSAPLASPA